jgi:integrase/recombinase XerD
MNRVLPKFYSEPQMRALACAPDPLTLKGLRDRALIGLLCATGLRASEACGLRVRDVRPTLVFVRRGKFGAQRWVPLSARAWAAVQAYLELHPTGPDEPLFRSVRGHALGRRDIHKIVTGYSRALGLRGPGVHTLRHSFATRAVNHGVNLVAVKAMLGHAQLSTTAVYVGTATDALVREYQRCLGGASFGGCSQ